MTAPEDNIERLVRKLIYQHCHDKSKEYKIVVAKYLTNDLDFDEAENIIEKAEDRLTFVKTADDLVWYLQNEELILFVAVIFVTMVQILVFHAV